MNELIAGILLVLLVIALYDPGDDSDNFGGPDNIHSY